MEVLGPGFVDCIQHFREISLLDLGMPGFEVTALEESSGMLFYESDELLSRFSGIENTLELVPMFRGQLRPCNQVGNTLLFENIIFAGEQDVLGQCLNGGNEPDEYHFSINAHLFEGTGVVMTRQDKFLVQSFIEHFYAVQEFSESHCEVLALTLKNLRVNVRVASHADERVFRLDSDTVPRVVREESAGNQIETAPKEY